MRTIGVVTVGRSDYGIYLPVLHKINASTELRLHLIVSGTHLSPEFGRTEKDIKVEGFEINERVEMLLSSDTPEGIAKSIGLGIIGLAQSYSRFRPDILLLLGDRFEMLSAAVAAIPYNIPIAHIHGGELTEGAIDEKIRHSITKMSHLHFTSTELHRRRVIQLGEEPWRVIVSGAPGLDNVRTVELLSRQELEQEIGVSLRPSPLLVTYHPVTLEYSKVPEQFSDLLAALDATDLPVVFTYPNADTNGRAIIEAIQRFVQSHKCSQVVANLGTRRYLSLMKYSRAMVGNSSSGIIEAASFKLPVVNIGNRQQGRVRGKNVIDVSSNRHSIEKAIRQAISTDFSSGLSDMDNPYGDGRAASRIVDTLQSLALDQEMITKKFYDIPLVGMDQSS
ncbi:MAG: UDP-N-acetylglucosamine 2-epimerase [Thermodesulfobacteriota bacterium]|nr:UDP-N-acetylglucosamine 2-epimerase [Thermodesulfobacteriota bacterium]